MTMLQRLQHAATRLRREIHERIAKPGIEPVDIRALISPLRYDVVIRAEFFDFLADHPNLSSLDLVEAAKQASYAAWFEHIECARYFPELLHNRELQHESFTQRVEGAVRLLRSFEAEGFNMAHPVTLIAAPAGSVADSGAPAMRGLHIGDGCHRVSLLLRQDAQLEPSMYRVRAQLAPLVDNTAILLRHSALTEAEYVTHLAGCFPVGDAKSVRDAQAHVMDEAPELTSALSAVLSAQWQEHIG